jgi:hypothetical protein
MNSAVAASRFIIGSKGRFRSFPAGTALQDYFHQRVINFLDAYHYLEAGFSIN